MHFFGLISVQSMTKTENIRVKTEYSYFKKGKWWEIKFAEILGRVYCSECLPDTQYGGSMPLRNVGNVTFTPQLQTSKFLPLRIKAGSSLLQSTLSLYPLWDESNEAVWPDLYSSTRCVCLWGGGPGRGGGLEKERNATEWKEFAKPANRHKTTSTQDQFACSLRLSTFLRWTSTHPGLYLYRHTWELPLWCNSLLSDCTIVFFSPCFVINRLQHNHHTTLIPQLTKTQHSFYKAEITSSLTPMFSSLWTISCFKFTVLDRKAQTCNFSHPSLMCTDFFVGVIQFRIINWIIG